jgi:hypothetical protein
MRVTGGVYPAKRLPENYYSIFIRAAQEGGMAAVAAMDHWKAVIAARPANGKILTEMPPATFIDVMTTWRAAFVAGVDYPVAGLTEAEIGAIKAPTIIIPGNDMVHSHASGLVANKLMPGSKLHELPIKDEGAELVPYADWKPHEAEIARVYVDFMKGVLAKA